MLFISILYLIMVIAISSLKNKILPILFQRMSSIILIYAGALSLNALYIQSIGSGIGIYSGLFHVTFISQLLEIFIYIIGAAIIIASSLPIYVNYNNNSIILENNNKYSIEYCLLIIFCTLGASLLISSSNLLSLYLSIELQSFSVYILSTLYKNSKSATSAGLKYFLLGSLASCFILLGSGLIYSFTGLTNLESIYNLISITEPLISNISQGIALGFIFIFVGFLLKISAAPLHNWAPDVYDESPTIVTIWLTIIPKISILFFILEVYTKITTTKPILYSLESKGLNAIKYLLLISSFFSLIIGTVVGLVQTKIKRLLAYSTISHIGFILLALAINSVQSIDSFIFYIIQYTLTNLNTFLILLAIGYIINKNIKLIKGSEKDINFISELKGLFFSNPILSISLTICLLSMAGTPPLLGFFSKQFVLYSAIDSGYYFMSISGILVSIISAFYYLRIIRILHTEIEIKKSLNDETNTIVGISNIHSLIISSLTLLILFFVIKPSIILKSTQLLSLTLYSD
uniref:NADH-ubiquinone oxidoreductase chain 2 n=1 Tax=Thelephora ganbajun TaxID=370292 RepID=A0A343B758_THEGA|nr:NADH dehydrogenase subunit 2 [Thelephora ganbajun]